MPLGPGEGRLVLINAHLGVVSLGFWIFDSLALDIDEARRCRGHLVGFLDS